MARHSPRARFRLYPSATPDGAKGSLYVRVKIWPDRASFQRYAKGWTCQHALAFCTDQFDRKTTHLVAEVNLYSGALTLPLIVHELTHATFYWSRRVRLPLSVIEADGVQEEEAFCYALHSLVRQFVDRTRTLGLLA